MHYEVGVGDAGMDGLDAINGQDVTGRRAGELVGAVGGADGDGQRVDLGLLDEVGGFFGVGQQHGVIQVAAAVLQGAQAAQFAFDGNATGMRQLGHLGGNLHVVLVGGRGLGIFLQGAIHHDRAEAALDRAEANGRRGAMILVHTDRNFRIGFQCGKDQVTQKGLTRIFAGAGGYLDQRGAVGFLGGFHDGMKLLEVVDVEGRYAVIVFGCVIQQLTK